MTIHEEIVAQFETYLAENTKFEDCNIKRTNYKACALKNVSFRYSNTQDAYFS